MEKTNFFNLSIADYSSKEAEYLSKGFTKIEQRSNLPVGSAIGKLKLFNGEPKINLFVRQGTTSDGSEYKIIVSSVKMTASDVTGATYSNVTASFDDSTKTVILNPVNWLKDCTLETVKVERTTGKPMNVTSVTSVG